MRRNGDDEDERDLRRRVAAGDDEAAFDLVRLLAVRGVQVPEDVTHKIVEAARRRIEALERESRDRERHQGYRNYETFAVAMMIRDDRVLSEWFARTARRLWEGATPEERAHDRSSYSVVALRLADVARSAIEGFTTDEPNRVGVGAQPTYYDTFEDEEIRALVGAIPRRREELAFLYMSLLGSSFGRVHWREVAEEILANAVPEHGPRAGR